MGNLGNGMKFDGRKEKRAKEMIKRNFKEKRNGEKKEVLKKV